MWRLFGYEWNSGEKLQLQLDTKVPGYTLPATLVCGVRPGKTLLITAGIHSDEYPGIAAAIRIAADLDPALLAGNVLILPCVNIGGFWARSVAKIPEDGFNLNADYPGKPDGTEGERLADFFVRQIFPKVDFILDLHSGSVMEPLTPCLFFPGWDTPVHQRRDASREALCEKEDANRETSCGEGAGSRITVREVSLAAAKALSIPYLVESHASGGEYSYAARYFGIPGLLLERGHSGMYEREWADEYVRDIRLLLAHLGMAETESMHPGITETEGKRTLDCAADRPDFSPASDFAGERTGEKNLPEEKYVCTKAVYLEASEPGLWYPRVRENDRIHKGHLLGHTEDFFGNRIREYYAEDDGIVFYYCCSLSVTEGRLLAAYGTEFEQKVE